MKLHHAKLKEHFGPNQYWVNLVNRHGREAVVGNAFERAFAVVAPEQVTYHPFDFHKLCKRKTMDNVSASEPCGSPFPNTGLTRVARRGVPLLQVWQVADAAEIVLEDMGVTSIRHTSANVSTAVGRCLLQR